jgi:NarL family two-component system response regulator LiaR
MSGEEKIKILLVDDHDMVRQGLMVLLRTFDDFEVVGETADSRKVLSLCAELQPDVVLMDIFMPHMSGVAATKLVHEHFPYVHIIALSSTAERNLVEDMFKAGAMSYIIKTGSIDEVAAAIRASMCGTATLAPEVTNVLLNNIHQSPQFGYDLTRQELKVLALLVEGLNNREIANRMVVSQSTVKAHVGSIFSKLNTNSRTKAIAIAVRNHILDRARATQ